MTWDVLVELYSIAVRGGTAADKSRLFGRLSKTGNELPKVEMPGENFWRRPGFTQGYRIIQEEENDTLSFLKKSDYEVFL
ncbi:hypothetical protein TNCV_3840031 [Trichonephila clavipes]|nr:hypothetical protein TNCV_3840031 [Trichonephila clavipes]